MKRLISIAAIALLAGLAYLLGWSNFFPVKSIEIAEGDQSIVTELTAKLNQAPAPIIIGEPIARVDKREITTRLRTLIWVEDVQVQRSFFSGKVSISVEPRSAIAQLDARWSANPSELGFLGSDLEFFFVPESEVAKAAKSGDADWLSLPNLSLGSSERSLIEDVVVLISADQAWCLFSKGLVAMVEVNAPRPGWPGCAAVPGGSPIRPARRCSPWRCHSGRSGGGSPRARAHC